MPDNNCGFYGAGSQGCLGPYCYTWIRGDRCAGEGCRTGGCEWTREINAL